MKQAKSIYQGGELIDAKHCNYDSSKELGLLCPFCDEPVFLVRECVRQRQKSHKIFLVDPFFSHYKSGDISDCELRSRSKEGQAYLEQLTPVKKGQRLDLFNKFFWEIVRDNYTYVEPKLKKGMTTNLDRMIAHAYEYLVNNKNLMFQYVHEYAEWLCSRSTECQDIYKLAGKGEKWRGKLSRVEEEDVQNFYQKTIKDPLHKAITFEAVDFLATHKAGIAFRKLIVMVLDLVPFDEDQQKMTTSQMIAKLINGLVQVLFGVGWLEELELKAKMKQDTRGLGFG